MSSLPAHEPEPRPVAPLPASTVDDDTIDLAQIVAFCQRHWRRFALGVLAALLIAGLLFALLPSRWQAEATVEIGQMPVGSATALIEPPAQAAERLKQRELTNLALANLNIPTDQPSDPKASLFRHTLKPVVVKNTNFIRVSIAGYSPQAAHDNLVAAITTLIGAHNKLMTPTVSNMQTRLADNARRISDAQAELMALRSTVRAAREPAARTEFAPQIVAVSELANKEQQIDRLKLERVALEDLMTPARTYPTRIIDAVYVNPQPSFPKLPLFAAIALLLGLGLGLCWALYREWRTRSTFGTAGFDRRRAP